MPQKTLKLLRTIRLDPSDAFVFARAAEPGEWAVSGSFLFWERPVDTLIGKERSAFRSGLMGITSFGWSTLATIVEVTQDEVETAIETLAQQLITHCGAPDRESARQAALAEIAYAIELAEPPVGTLVAVHRSLEDGEIRERFRTLLPGTDEKHSRAFLVIEDKEDEIDEMLDLVGMASVKQESKG